jgi:hypothetical protein
VSIGGLFVLAVSLAGGSGAGGTGSTAAIVLWLGVTAGVAVVLMAFARMLGGVAVAYGVAAGLFFSIGDISTKIATEGGTRVAFVLTLILGYTLGTGLLQVGYQAGGALTVAGLATLLTNALPIAAGTVVLDEPIPSGAFGGLRILAFAAVILGAVFLARPASSAAGQEDSAPATVGTSPT